PHLLVDHRRAASAAVADSRGANGLSLQQLRWPASFRNGGRHQIGTVAGFKSESVAGLRRNSQLLRPLAEGGDAGAQWLVGEMYDEGQGVQQNSGQAAVWYRKAAEQGDDTAQLDLGVKYLLGDGVPENYSE